MRPLSLHSSALSDAEYDHYTATFREIVGEDEDDGAGACVRDDAYYERTTVGVREARAWLRGRYTDLATGDIDLILKLFAPELGRTDTLDGGQFFAALRLLTHVRAGAAVDRTLVFVQAHPDAPPSRPQSPPRRAPSQTPQPPPPRPPPYRRQLTTTVVAPAPDHSPVDQPSPDGPPPPLPVRHDTHRRAASLAIRADPAPVPSPNRNPFARAKPAVLEPPAAAPVSKPPPPSPPKAAPRATSPAKLPPLPPRKPAALQPPPRHSSLMSALSDPTPGPSKPSPHPHPQPALHAMSSVSSALISPLIKTSLQASKVAQMTRRAEELREKERVLLVVKSSSAAPVHAPKPRSASPTKAASSDGSAAGHAERDAKPRPPLPARRDSAASRPSFGADRPMPTRAASSPFDPPDTTSTGTTSTNPFRARRPASASRSPSRSEGTGAARAPPTHPDRKAVSATAASFSSSASQDDYALAGTGQARMFRSRSMYQPTSPASASTGAGTASTHGPPIVPPRRRRPESVQYTPTSASSATFFGSSPFDSPPESLRARARDRDEDDFAARRRPATASGQFTGGAGLSRHLSLSAPRRARDPSADSAESAPSPLAHLQKTFASLGVRAQPRIEKALFKAEAGLSPKRGYGRAWERARGGVGERLVAADDERGDAEEGEGERVWPRAGHEREAGVGGGDGGVDVDGVDMDGDGGDGDDGLGTDEAGWRGRRRAEMVRERESEDGYRPL